MLFSLAYNGYDHLIGQAYDGVAISLLFTLMDADLVRTACLAAPDFPILYGKRVAAAVF